MKRNTQQDQQASLHLYAPADHAIGTRTALEVKRNIRQVEGFLFDMNEAEDRELYKVATSVEIQISQCTPADNEAYVLSLMQQ